MRFFFRRGSTYLLAAMLALMATAIASAPAVAQQERDRPGRGWRRDRERNGERPGGRRGEDRPQPRVESPRPAETSASSTPVPSGNSFGTVSDAERIRQRASQMVKEHDKSGNGILEGDELEKLGMSRGADKDGDGVITRDDLIAFYSPKSPTAGAPAATSAASTTDKKPEDTLERTIVNNKRKSYRFKSTKDRTNKWRFSSRDANGDGQVSMSEYSGSWTDRTAAEFMRYDKDNDGMITADEAK